MPTVPGKPTAQITQPPDINVEAGRIGSAASGLVQSGAIGAQLPGKLAQAANQLGKTGLDIYKDLKAKEAQKEQLITTNNASDAAMKYITDINLFWEKEKAKDPGDQADVFNSFKAKQKEYRDQYYQNLTDQEKAKFDELTRRYDFGTIEEAAKVQASQPGRQASNTLVEFTNRQMKSVENAKSMQEVETIIQISNSFHDGYVGPLKKEHVDTLKSTFADKAAGLYIGRQLELDTIPPEDLDKFARAFYAKGFLSKGMLDGLQKEIKNYDKAKLADVAKKQDAYNGNTLNKFMYTVDSDIKKAAMELRKMEFEAATFNGNPERTEKYLTDNTIRSARILYNQKINEARREKREAEAATIEQVKAYTNLQGQIDAWLTGDDVEVKYSSLIPLLNNGVITPKQFKTLGELHSETEKKVESGEDKAWQKVKANIEGTIKAAPVSEDSAENINAVDNIFKIARGMAGNPKDVTPEIIAKARADYLTSKASNLIGSLSRGMLGTSDEEKAIAQANVDLYMAEASEQEKARYARRSDRFFAYLSTTPEVITQEQKTDVLGPIIDKRAEDEGRKLSPQERAQEIETQYQTLLRKIKNAK